jgi:hypothetical protein
MGGLQKESDSGEKVFVNMWTKFRRLQTEHRRDAMLVTQYHYVLQKFIIIGNETDAILVTILRFMNN